MYKLGLHMEFAFFGIDFVDFLCFKGYKICLWLLFMFCIEQNKPRTPNLQTSACLLLNLYVKIFAHFSMLENCVFSDCEISLCVVNSCMIFMGLNYFPIAFENLACVFNLVSSTLFLLLGDL